MTPVVRNALGAFRVVVVTGPRQAGKTTLVRQVLDGRGVLNRLDDAAVRQAALADPASFVRYGELPRAIDEVQLAGDPVIRAIKTVVDEDSRPGQFLLDGSADFLTVPTISESLAGRAVFLELWPFSQGELEGAPDGLVDVLLEDPDSLRSGQRSRVGLEDYLERVCRGGFPEAVRLAGRTRGTWYGNYVRTVTQRDIRDVTGARKADRLPRLLRLLAARTAGELVVTHLHADLPLGSRETTEDYLGFLEMTYLTVRVPAWSRSLTTKVKRHPKVYLADSGLAAHLVGKAPAALRRPTDPARGPLVETFVAAELRKQAGWTKHEAGLHHFRDRGGAEVDLVLECSDGRVAAIEVKASTTVTDHDFRWLAWMRDRMHEEFMHGLVLYAGDRPLAFGDRLTAVPLSYLWEVG
jgi:predicted AAA+ superfamily ATPase